MELPAEACSLGRWHLFCCKVGVHATFMQKVIICAVLGFLAAALVEWGKVFVEGADDALNGGYKQRTTDTLSTKP